MKKLIISLALMSLSVVSARAASAPIYTGVSGGWFKNRGVESWGGGAHVGFELAEKRPELHQGLELEVWGLQGRGHASESSEPFIFEDEGAIGQAVRTSNRSVKLTQVPVMVNYRVWGKANESSSMTWYAGAGIGCQWARSKDRLTESFVMDPGGPVSINPYSKNHNHALLTGQLFAGLGYEFSDALSATLGARVLMTKRQTWSGSNAETVAPVRTGVCQLGVELGLNYAY